MIALKLLPLLRAGPVVAAIAMCSTAIAQPFPGDRPDAAIAYAQCVRDNGYAEFPDPAPDGGFQFLIEPGGLQRFEAATAACRDLAPEGFRDEAIAPETLEALLELAQCVRENGVPNFPDPDAEGRFDPSAIGMQPGDPRIAAAMAACDQAGLREGGRLAIGG